MAHYADLRNRTVVVTGGANGIGEAIVRAFHAQQASVHFCDRDAAAGEALVRELGERFQFKRVELTREAEIVRWVMSIAKGGKPIDAVINNAARDPRMKLEDMSVKDWDELFHLNLRAYFLMARECAPHLPDGSGAIVNLASITFHIAPAPMTAYVATKGGILGFTRSLARELGPRGIRVNTVSPGWVMTERQLNEFVDAATKRMLRKSQSIPQLLQPEEIADVVVFLASEASRGMTGQELLVDHGWVHS
jgi:NAD(P)-dependent dehydrogenase (short-subunit alcohol dehydrogenase family)